MNILLVTAMFPPIKTGTSFYSRNLADALHKKGHQVTVVTVANDEAGIDGLSYPVHRLSAWHVPIFNFFKHFRLCSIFPKNYRRISALAKSTQTDVVILVNHYLDIAFLAIHAARAASVPLACSIGTQLQSSIAWRNQLLNFFDRLICGRMIFPHCDSLVAWDREILRYLADVQGPKIADKCSIINFGVNGNPAAFLAYDHDYSLHNQLLAVGSVIRQRSYIPLIAAFGHLAAEFPELRLKIVGHVYFDESLRFAQRLGIAGRVTFTGELPHDQVLREITRSDMYFVSLTARYLGLGTATLECMLMGVPTLANVYPDLLGRVRLEDMQDIVLLENLTPEHIAGKIRALLLNADTRRRVGSGGRAFVKKRMAWDVVANEYEELLHRLQRPNT